MTSYVTSAVVQGVPGLGPLRGTTNTGTGNLVRCLTISAAGGWNKWCLKPLVHSVVGACGIVDCTGIQKSQRCGEGGGLCAPFYAVDTGGSPWCCYQSTWQSSWSCLRTATKKWHLSWGSACKLGRIFFEKVRSQVWNNLYFKMDTLDEFLLHVVKELTII